MLLSFKAHDIAAANLPLHIRVFIERSHDSKISLLGAVDKLYMEIPYFYGT
jgi:hypothetical protein